jgi:hypothetical protein
MTIEQQVQKLRADRINSGIDPIPVELQGVDKQRIERVLKIIDRNSPDMVDVIFALLDDITDSWFSKAPIGMKFSHGATTAHIGCHVGILQRGKTKLDREGRDYWIKPLIDLGAIDRVYFRSAQGDFIYGHPKAKSPLSSYRLNSEFRKILIADDIEIKLLLSDWIKEDKIRERVELQAKLAEESKKLIDTKHSDLIHFCKDYYVPYFLPGYEIIFIDLEDGDRITENERITLGSIGIQLSLEDAMPDLLLFNPTINWLWVIEAVTSDGEVDIHKKNQLTGLAVRSGKSGIGFTTAYMNWKTAATRQQKHKNIAPDTYVWIAKDPSKQFHVLEMKEIIKEKVD